MLKLALRVANCRRNHARYASVRELDAPEAAAAKGGDRIAGLGHGLDLARVRIRRSLLLERALLEVRVVARASRDAAEEVHQAHLQIRERERRAVPQAWGVEALGRAVCRGRRAHTLAP